MRSRFSNISITVSAIWSGGIALAMCLVWYLFVHFGSDFAFVVVPVGIAAVAGYIIHLKRLAQKTNEVSQAGRVHLATVEALATAIDARDQVGLGHVRRTQIIAVGLGRILGMSESDIDALRTGALLHDIGKLAVPDHILNKPGELTPAEVEKTKIHPAVGAAILEKVGFASPVIPTVRSHHERWDGTGYPDGLKGEEIPITARVLAVADTFDTLRGVRGYRDALSREKARQVIQTEAGGRLDPTIVSALVRNLTELEQQVNSKGLSYDDEKKKGGRTSSDQDFVDQIKSANREVFSLYELAREFSTSLNLNETLNMFTRKIREFVPFSTCVLYLLDDTKRSATASYVEGENADLIALKRTKIGQGATGFVLKKREAVKGADPDLDFYQSHPELTGRYTAMASVPLIADEELIGAISIYSRDLPDYGDEHIRLLDTISVIAAEAIARSLKHSEATAHALTDTMTGLPNARSLQLEFEKEAGRAGRTGTSFQLLMLDLDGFKKVNDSFGHKVGDRLLYEVGKVIRGQLREYDFLARYGGDEFVALVPEISPAGVSDLCGRIEKAVCDFRLHVKENEYARVGVSLGSAGYQENGDTFDRMVMAADKAMYASKMRRKAVLDRVPVFLEPLKEVQIEPTESEGFIIELDETHVVAAAHG